MLGILWECGVVLKTRKHVEQKRGHAKSMKSLIFVKICSMVGGKCFEVTQRNNACYPMLDDQLVIRPVCRASLKCCLDL